MTKYRIPILRPFIAQNTISLIQKTLNSGWIGEGKQTYYFEKLVSKYIDNPKFVALNSCTSALFLSLHLAGVTKEDEVITTPMTCLATNIPILYKGAKVIWANISKDGTINPKSIQKKITPRTKAIIMVHFGGYPCDIDSILKIAKANSCILIEDAAHALGSFYKGKVIGGHSDFVCFSFQAVKTITTADGGGIAFHSTKLFKKAQKLRWFGVDRKDPFRYEKDIDELGFRFTMNDVLASLGIQNMKYIDYLLKRRKRLASEYISALESVSGLTVCHTLSSQRSSSYWLFPILVEDKQKFISNLANAGIESSPVHWRNDKYSIFKNFQSDGLDMVDYWDKHMVCLPIGHWISDDDIEYIIKTIKKGYY